MPKITIISFKTNNRRYRLVLSGHYLNYQWCLTNSNFCYGCQSRMPGPGVNQGGTDQPHEIYNTFFFSKDLLTLLAVLRAKNQEKY